MLVVATRYGRRKGDGGGGGGMDAAEMGGTDERMDGWMGGDAGGEEVGRRPVPGGCGRGGGEEAAVPGVRKVSEAGRTRERLGWGLREIFIRLCGESMQAAAGRAKRWEVEQRILLFGGPWSPKVVSNSLLGLHTKKARSRVGLEETPARCPGGKR